MIHDAHVCLPVIAKQQDVLRIRNYRHSSFRELPAWEQQGITVERDACSDREHLKPGWSPGLVKDGTFNFKIKVQVRQLWSFPGRKVCYQEGKWPIKATASSIGGTKGTDLVEKEKEKWSLEGCRKHTLKDLGCHTNEFELNPGANS